MPVPDPVPPPVSAERALLGRFVRMMRIAALFAVLSGAGAVALVARGEDKAPIHMLIATALGVGLSVLVGMALMSLMFLSSRMGHDEEAARPPEKEET